MEPLEHDDLTEALAALPGWEHTEGSIHRDLRFADFRSAIGFLVRLAFEAEQRNHHPELTNVYNRVGVTLTTHDAGNRVTQKDLDLAAVVNELAPPD